MPRIFYYFAPDIYERSPAHAAMRAHMPLCLPIICAIQTITHAVYMPCRAAPTDDARHAMMPLFIFHLRLLTLRFSGHMFFAYDFAVTPLPCRATDTRLCYALDADAFQPRRGRQYATSY